MNQSLLNQFGIPKKGFYYGGPFLRFKNDIKSAVKNNDMLAIVGEVGSGKSTLFREAARELTIIRDQAPIFIYVRNFYKEHLNIAGIINAIIFDISDEHPRRDLEARSRQVVRLMGLLAYEQKKKICVVIEEAHRVHANTLRAIKELREAEFAGISPLFSIILIGHPQLRTKLEMRKEVFWRSDIIELNESQGWMNYQERINFLKSVFGDAMNSEARNRVAILKKMPLEMEFFVAQKMKEAHLAGKTILDGETIQTSLLEMKESLSVSLGELAQMAGMGKTTVHEILHGTNTKPEKVNAVKSALDKLAKRKEKSMQTEGAVA